MDELELVRLHEDGERLVLAARDGAQSTLPITDALRAAIRGDRPRVESIRAQEASSLRPREIQERLRAGETCEVLAEASGLPHRARTAVRVPGHSPSASTRSPACGPRPS